MSFVFKDFVTQAENKENNHLNSFNTSESKPNSTELPLKASDAKVPQNQPDIGNISLFSFLKVCRFASVVLVACVSLQVTFTCFAAVFAGDLHYIFVSGFRC